MKLLSKLWSWLVGGETLSTYHRITFKKDDKLIYDGPESNMPLEVKEAYQKARAEIDEILREFDEHS